MPPVKGNMWAYTENNMKKAIQDVSNGISVKKAAKDNRVPRTTLRAKISGKSPMQRRMGPFTVLSMYEEEILEDWVKEMSRAGFPVTSQQLQGSVQHIIKECKRKTPFTDGKPGKTWLASFLRRHPSISRRVAENLTLSRASVTRQQVMSWFTEIELYLKENNLFEILKDPRRNFNGDESAFFLNPKGNRVLASKGQKAVYLNVNSDEKECLTVLVTASAAGVMAPPMVVFKYERIPTNVIRSVPNGWGIGKSENGWMTQATFFEYVTNIFHPWLVKAKITLPVILFVDGHTSHLTLHLSKFCQENGIILIALYPNTTHFMQPMDVSVFKALKETWKVKVHDWRLQHIDNPILKKIDFCHLLKEVMDETVTQTIVSNGFRRCGLIPWNPEAISVWGNPTEDHHEKLRLIDSKQVKHALDVLEKVIDVEKLTLFKSCEQTSSWTGSTEDASLFNIWKTMNTLTKTQEEPEVLEPMAVDPTLVQEETCILTSPTNATVLDMGMEMVNFEDDHESLSEEQPLAVMATTGGEFPPSHTPMMIMNLEAETVEAGTSNAITPSRTPFNLLPSPFKKCLVWPQEKINDKKKLQKQKIPSVVSSENYQAYLNKKQDAKLQQEQKKKERAEERARKKEEKEKVARKKKEMKASAKKVVKKTNTKCTNNNKKSKARRKKKTDSTSEDDCEIEDWTPSESEDREMPSDANSDEEWPLHSFEAKTVQSTSHDDNIHGGTSRDSSNEQGGPCVNGVHDIVELIDDQELLRQADDFCLTFGDALGEQEEECEHSLGTELLQSTEHLLDEYVTREPLEELERTSRVDVDGIDELPSNDLKPELPINEKNRTEIAIDLSDNPTEKNMDHLAIEQGDYIVAVIQGAKKLQKFVCKVYYIDYIRY